MSKFFDYEYEICTSVVNIQVPTISLFATIPLSEEVVNNLKIKLLPSESNYVEENSSHWEEYGKHSLDHLGKCDDPNGYDCDILENDSYVISEDSENELIITLPTTFCVQNTFFGQGNEKYYGLLHSSVFFITYFGKILEKILHISELSRIKYIRNFARRAKNWGIFV